jgi:hypothetical protein
MSDNENQVPRGHDGFDQLYKGIASKFIKSSLVVQPKKDVFFHFKVLQEFF